LRCLSSVEGPDGSGGLLLAVVACGQLDERAQRVSQPHLLHRPAIRVQQPRARHQVRQALRSRDRHIEPVAREQEVQPARDVFSCRARHRVEDDRRLLPLELVDRPDPDAPADAGGGNAHYAETPDAAPAIFAEELEGLTRVVAQNVSLEIRPQEQVEVLAILNDYPHLAVPGGVQVQLGDGYGGERRRIVFSLHVPQLAELGPVHLADLVLRYVSVGEEIAHLELTIPVTANAVSAAEAAATAPDGEVQEEVLLLKAAQAREEAIRLADVGDFDAAQDTLHAAGVEFDVSSAAYSPAARKRLWYDQYQARRGKRN
jgi:hypothetical protein